MRVTFYMDFDMSDMSGALPSQVRGRVFAITSTIQMMASIMGAYQTDFDVEPDEDDPAGIDNNETDSTRLPGGAVEDDGGMRAAESNHWDEGEGGTA